MARTNLAAANGSTPLRQLPGAAIRAVLREGYARSTLRSDILAGLVVGIVALPLSMALAINVGAAPQYGLYTAIVAGFWVALLGGSRTQVTGPTAAFIPILAPIFLKYGLGGLLLSGLLGGLILLGMGFFRLGRLIEFIPYPVTTGFTAGIAVVIATLQLKDFLGLQGVGRPEHYHEILAALWRAAPTANWKEMLVGSTTLVLLLGVPRLSRKVPAPLLVLPAVAAGVLLSRHFWPSFDVATIAGRFHTEIAGKDVAGIPQLPPLPLLPWRLPGGGGAPLVLNLALFRDLLPGAFAVAMLGAIESLLSAVVADGMARTKHDPDAELLALGVGNLLCPFFGGIPATGAIARTATNIRYGGRTPVASMTHALTILAAVLALAPLIGHLPMASLAALLLVVARNMAEAKHFSHILKVAPRSDRAVLLVCFSLTVILDMVVSVTAGVVLAALLFMRRMADISGSRVAQPHEFNVPKDLPEGVSIYNVAGPLFFGAAQKAMETLGVVDRNIRVIVLRMNDVPAMDATGLVALESAIENLEKRRCSVVMVGCHSQPRRLIRQARLKERFPHLRLRASLERGIETAEALLASAPVPPDRQDADRRAPGREPRT
jgi:SulP family sulfate permease